jgi:hypothetical protein
MFPALTLGHTLYRGDSKYSAAMPNGLIQMPEQYKYYGTTIITLQNQR